MDYTVKQLNEQLEYERKAKAEAQLRYGEGATIGGLGMAGATAGKVMADVACGTTERGGHALLWGRIERLRRELRELEALYVALPRELPPEADRGLAMLAQEAR